ncbi:unnamed protein product [Prorocentrum cordatum]|uniref:Uncharacterized protein n=1 Tax=Prorocentrum cordatum TaxID=2364126 RepID=A0ABN9RSH0_9DINO|nr:unnamed protein product [Polarella glacialis]
MVASEAGKASPENGERGRRRRKRRRRSEEGGQSPHRWTDDHSRASETASRKTRARADRLADRAPIEHAAGARCSPAQAVPGGDDSCANYSHQAIGRSSMPLLTSPTP